ncbi:MAG: excinuclease ABC subunit C [Candidatus Levybacteria bacterium CG10_big_fil_rev_8_21_14_0_10_35_13]|nr:MAG: excinuclease ABC subunit C [Candidatus Levybacteria bacterium CG10_big_fil_rev_8_21_14_0_10_35_13]
MYFVYVLACKRKNSNKFVLYIGSTLNLDERIKQHKFKNVLYTKQFDTIVLIYYEACINKKDSLIREKQLKTGFGRCYLKRRLKNYFDCIKQM